MELSDFLGADDPNAPLPVFFLEGVLSPVVIILLPTPDGPANPPMGLAAPPTIPGCLAVFVEDVSSDPPVPFISGFAEPVSGPNPLRPNAKGPIFPL